ncbi:MULTISPECIES: MinD/ParA family protein [unclassified Desulfovibrio]|uniref:MinD/ParA family protein n=1 Tax=unclassified Desulfovibrio TaxID=2593640 RepID=UPI000F5F8B87|nr:MULTISPECIES: MinD/ParA family protein [unclassified Desulfovibrio]RRD71052.1 MinD/ParA family protein [Desulfovibrio sp. OH1209_COT-279]RRD87394.1 MinD/ParA family protein [Desulfovibrio sp. OH1186_COT-070]
MATTTLSVALLSGKGGVGKTNISLNLACALYQNGYKNLLMDCDLGLANLDVLLGITPEANLQTALLGQAEMADVLYHLEPQGFDILPAASGVPELTEIRPDERDLLLSRLEGILHGYDYVFLDIGAGISGTVQTFAAMAAMRIVVITPEPTSLTDSYALIKVLNSTYGLRDFMVLVNQAASAAEAKASFDKLHTTCRHFLHLEPMFLGHVRSDSKLAEAVCHQQMLLRYAPGSPASKDLQTIATKIQRLRLSMLDWLAPRRVLQPPSAIAEKTPSQA